MFPSFTIDHLLFELWKRRDQTTTNKPTHTHRRTGVKKKTKKKNTHTHNKRANTPREIDGGEERKKRSTTACLSTVCAKKEEEEVEETDEKTKT
jgi:hypothetical protein